MEFQGRLHKLDAMLQQATQESVMQENMLQGARQRVAEIQGRISELQNLDKNKDVSKKEPKGNKAR